MYFSLHGTCAGGAEESPELSARPPLHQACSPLSLEALDVGLRWHGMMGARSRARTWPHVAPVGGLALEHHRVTLAAIQAAPVFLHREATVAKAVQDIADASRLGAQVVVFPEAFIPAFPYWYYFFPAHSPACQDLYQRLFEEAVDVPGPATEKLGDAARAAQAWVVVGVNERRPGTCGTLYNSLLFFDPNGRLAGVHRKLVPTLSERLVHGAGDASGLKTYPASFGRLGGLICGEHFNSFARLALLLQEERVHAPLGLPSPWPARSVAAPSTSESPITPWKAACS